MPTIQPDQLERFAISLIAVTGAVPHRMKREVVGKSLVRANLFGYESAWRDANPVLHPSLERWRSRFQKHRWKSLMNRRRESLRTRIGGFGQVQATDVLNRLIAKTKQNGLSVGTIIHCGHIGRLGEYCEAAAAENLVSMVMVNSHGGAVRVAPPGGTAPRLSTNPLAIGVPYKDEPLVLDFSTSATAEGKVRVKKIAGQKCPEGWLLDNQGNPTTDPNSLYGNPPGSILPMGGPQAYKGFGLGLMIEILTGALSGGVTAREKTYPKKGNCVFLLLLDPAGFGGAEHFRAEVEQLVDYIRGCPRIPGVDRILLPGDPERMTLAQRVKGIFLDDENWGQLVKFAGQLKVALPAL